MQELTPFQTVGPFLSLGLAGATASVEGVEGGPAILIEGRLIDGAGQGVPDGVLEFWHPALAGVGRALTQPDGGFRLEAVKPPAVPGAGGVSQRPHLALRVLGRGILTHYATRVYFDDDADRATDAILDLVPADRRATLIARRTRKGAYHFDVVLQGEGETVFFDV